MNILNKPITDDDTLNNFYNQCIKEKTLAIDTEFIRENTYYPSLCLIQIAGSNFAGAIDPFSGINLEPIWEILINKNILKIFHAARQDIEIFLNLTGKIPFPIYDTQIASMFCGLGDQIGYERLVDRFLGLPVNKQFQFTNWVQRPLSQQQIDYAISDVTHLIKIYPLINKLIEDSKRTTWVEKEMMHLSDKNLYHVEPDQIWKRIKLKNIKPQILNTLKYLAMWRETECIDRNIPRNKLIRDDALINISYASPKTIDELKKTRGLPKNLSNKDFDQIINVIKESKKIDKNEWPLISRNYNKSNVSKSSVDLLKLLLKLCSDESGLAEKLIADTEDLRSVIEGDRDNLKIFEGWRNDVFGKKVLSLLNGEIGFTIQNDEIKTLVL